jgi:DEAD/DEAH box helicase domain-containing protein
MDTVDAKNYLTHLLSSPSYRGQAVHIEKIGGSEAVYGDLQTPLPEPLIASLRSKGIERLYSHQVQSIELLRQGKNVAVVTSTASGKSLCYNLPVLETMLSNSQARALYIYPTKALAQDQLRGLQRLVEAAPGLELLSGAYDGDTPPDTRRRLRDRGRIILTNPDMLHQGILPKHTGWAHFFANLKYVVIDEIHSYRGVFGSNVANVMRRLRRICELYGSNPQFICCSATIANPGELCQKITGVDIDVIDKNGAPSSERYFVFWNPPFIDTGRTERRSSNLEAAELMCELIKNRHATIAFGKARIVAELLYRYCQEMLQKVSPSLAKAISPYRGGYLPEERREIERRLFEGELLGVTSTNALELGIDIGALEAAIIVGYPGSIASTWQQAGRAGRGKEPSLVFFIPHNTPIDQYLAQKPSYFMGRNPENAVIDPGNPHILLGQLRAAAFEKPLSPKDVEEFGEFGPGLMHILSDNQDVVWDGFGWRWRGRGFPAAQVNLRNMSDNTFSIVDISSGNKVIGSLDEPSAFQQIYEQAIYMHEGETYFVRKMDLQQRVSFVEKADVDYYTQSITEIKVQVHESTEEGHLNESNLVHGDVAVNIKPYMFRKIKFGSRDSIGYGKIDLPPQIMETTATWLIPPVKALNNVRKYGREPLEGLLGMANIIAEVLPVFVMCDTADIGSVVDVTNTGLPSIFIYDKYPGGLGFSRRAFDHMEEILQAGLEMINGCSCEIGCPSCVGSPIPPFSQLDPDTNARGRIPDKEAAKMLLHEILGLPPYIPQAPAASELARSGAGGPYGACGGGTIGAGGAIDASGANGMGYPAGAGAGAGFGPGQQGQMPSARPPAAEPLPEHLERRIRQQLQQLKKRE